MSDKFDLIVIGGGPAGYVAAIRASQLGLRTVCIDDTKGKDGKPALGGTCLNVGCIPSKALLDSSKHFSHLKHGLGPHGISVSGAEIDVGKMISRKDQIVKQLTGGIKQLFKANGITHIPGRATLSANRQVQLKQADGAATTLQAENIILAPGSIPVEIPSLRFDGKHIIDNAGALDLESVPARLGVIGAGVIGLELGSVWRRLGSEVVVLEALPDFLAAADRDISRAAAREFRKQGIEIRLGARVDGATVENDQVEVSYTVQEKSHKERFDKLLVAVGRRANTGNLLSDGCGVTLDDRGRIAVDDLCRTEVAGIWAIGDAVRGPMLAHKGSEEGVAVAERIAGHSAHLDLGHVPWVVYTEPEIAWVGKTEQQLKEMGVSYNTGTFPFAAAGRALAANAPSGMVKLLADKQSDRLLGAHILGAHASELIAEAVVTMEFSGSAEDLARIVHAHPTLSEAVHEAALAVDRRAIHKVNRQ